jgi:hypothetical protein
VGFGSEVLWESARCDLRSFWPPLEGSVMPRGVLQVEQWNLYSKVSVVVCKSVSAATSSGSKHCEWGMERTKIGQWNVFLIFSS